MLPGRVIGMRTHHMGSVCLDRTAQAGNLGVTSFITGGGCFALGQSMDRRPGPRPYRPPLPGYLLSQPLCGACTTTARRRHWLPTRTMP